MASTLVPDITTPKPTVLIVDDEAAPRAALTQILRQDFHILTAENARVALAVLDNHGVDLVTLDLKLPDRSGSDLLHDIKRTHAETEVIMVTAYGSLQSAMDCIRHGAAGFLLKPFNASELLAISLQTAQKNCASINYARSSSTRRHSGAQNQPVPKLGSLSSTTTPPCIAQDRSPHRRAMRHRPWFP